MNDSRDHAQYQDWDGAYVLGSLSSGERREYEAHLETCDRCRLAVADLSGLPGLLGRVDRDRAFSLLESEEDEDTPVPPPPADLVGRIEKAERRRRARRVWIAGGIAAAVLAAAAIAIPVTIAAQPHPTVAVALAPTTSGGTTDSLSADVQLTSVKWGTRIEMHCGYGSAATGGTGGYPHGAWSYALWVVDRSGKASEVSTWKAASGSQVKLTAATALSVGDIARIEVRSAATNDVLLAKRL